LALVDVKVLDHFIVAGSSVLSFAERGLVRTLTLGDRKT
jgi:DNA repair protein RadC